MEVRVFKPVLNITEQIAEYLADQIITDQLAGGQRIQEVKVARSLDVSRGSIREALLILERKHLIEIVPRRGAVVHELRDQDARELLDVFALLKKRWLLELLQLPTRQDLLRAAEPCVSAMEAAARDGNVAQVLACRVDYHVATLRPAGRYLIAVFESLLPTSQRLLFRLIRDANLDLYDLARLYRALHVALNEGSAERVEELMDAFHLRLSKLTNRMFCESVKTNKNAVVFG